MGKVISFFGVDNKVGTTMISLCVAQVLADRGLKTLVLHFDGNSGVDYIEDCQYCMDDIRLQLASGILTYDDISNICYCSGNFFNIKGSVGYIDRKRYTPEHGSRIIELVKEEYDYVLVDAGCSDIGLVVSAFTSSDLKVLIATQQATAYTKFVSFYQLLASYLGASFDKLIVNKFSYSKSAFLPVESNVFEMYGGFSGKDAVIVPASLYAWQAEKEKDTLLAYKEKPIIKAVSDIADMLTGEDNMGKVRLRKKKGGGK